MDFEAFRPIDPLIFSSNDGKGPQVFLSEEASTEIVNCAILGSVPRHPFFWLVIHEIMRREMDFVNKNKTLGVLQSTGPRMLTNMLIVYKDLYPYADIRVLKYQSNETKWIYPLNADDLGTNGHRESLSYACTITENCAELHNNSFGMHHFSGSWWPEYEHYLNTLADKRGNSSVIRI